MRVSIQDVANRAKVSVGTVSNVLNRPNLVAEETRARVRAAIDDLGFVRNESARQLRQGRGRTFGVIVEDMSNPYFTDLAHGAEDALNTDSLNTIWCTSDGSAIKEQRCIDFLEEQGALGILITPVSLDADQIARLRQQGMAIVVMDRRITLDACSVRVDHIVGGDSAVSHLLAQGHLRLAFVSGPANTQPRRDRREGAVRALRRAGLTETAMTTLVQETSTTAAGQEAAHRLLAVDPHPTAVFCTNDLLAVGLVNELLRLGVKVPQDVAVVGYDDIELAATAVVPLTTVRQPRSELGRVAADLALAESGDSGKHEHEEVVLQLELIIRESTGL